MSLINDALKKAQRHQGEHPSAQAGSPPATPAAVPVRPGRAPARSLGLTLLIALGSAALAIGTLLWWQQHTRTPVSPAPATPQPAPQPPPASPPAAPAVRPAMPDNPPAVASTPPAPPAVLPPPAPPEPPAPVLNLGTRIQAFIDRLQITSIRISDTGNRAILNGRLFRRGDLVEPSLGLRLTVIEPGSLTFTDENGQTYLRHF